MKSFNIIELLNTSSCVRRLLRFGSGHAGIEKIRRIFFQKAQAAPLHEQSPAAMSETIKLVE